MRGYIYIYVYMYLSIYVYLNRSILIMHTIYTSDEVGHDHTTFGGEVGVCARLGHAKLRWKIWSRRPSKVLLARDSIWMRSSHEVTTVKDIIART